LCAPERVALLGILVFAQIAGVAALPASDKLPEEPLERGTLLVPGRLPWSASALPTGEILAPCEDQSLSVLDAKAAPLTQWRAEARFSGPVTVGPRSNYQLLAVPLVTGRVDVLVWDPQTRVLAPAFALEHPGEASATAWGVTGTLHAGWRDGRVEAWSPKGVRLWAASTGFEVRFLLVDDNLGLYAFGPGKAVLFDPRGQEAQGWTLNGTPRGLLQTFGGDLYCWTETGLWKKSYDGLDFVLLDRSTQLLGVTVDRQDRLVLTEPHQLRRLSPSGLVQSTISLVNNAVTSSALDDRGRILVGTTKGLEAWTYDGRLLETLDPTEPASAPLLTDKGLGVWSTSDWKIHVWGGFRWPSVGWPQEGGGPGRPFSARRPTSVAVRAVNWADDPDFSYFYQLVASGEESKQREVLERFEAKAETGGLLATWPFANLILLKIGRSGLTDLMMVDRTRILNSWPALRLRAYALLAQTATPEDREELIALLHREYDPSVAAQGAQALAQSGWDGDGKLMRLLAELQNRMPDQAMVADAVIDAARSLWQTNGKSADPVLVPLVSAVFQGAYSRTIKLKAQKFFQDLLQTP